MRVEDPEATAAVLLGSLTSFRVFQTLLGDAPARLDDERFVRAWLRTTLQGLGVKEKNGPHTESTE